MNALRHRYVNHYVVTKKRQWHLPLVDLIKLSSQVNHTPGEVHPAVFHLADYDEEREGCFGRLVGLKA